MIKILYLILVLLAGCATRTPMPIPCEVRVKGECRELSPSEKAGPGVRGHGEIKETQP